MENFIDELKENVSKKVGVSTETMLKLFEDPKFVEVKDIHKCSEYVIALHILNETSSSSELDEDEYIIYIDTRDVIEARFKNLRCYLKCSDRTIFMGVIDIEFDTNNTRTHRFGFSSAKLYNNVKKFLNYEELDDCPSEE